MSLKKLWIEALKRLESSFKLLLWLIVASYRTIGTTHIGGTCRFTPHCSEYAIQALRDYTSFQAFKLIASRILRCHPFGKYGYDPLPERLGENSNEH